MEIEERFVQISGLICEPSRARILWQLLDDKVHTAGELASAADISATSASNHLLKLAEANIIRAYSQGRHRYYSLANYEVAYVVEALANLSNIRHTHSENKPVVNTGVTYCRTCYDHLAGFVGVSMTEAMVESAYLQKKDSVYLVTAKGWEWLAQFNLNEKDLTTGRRPLARQCLDWSERRPHLAGQLGARLLESMMERNWFRKAGLSRQLNLTPEGRKGFYTCFKLSL